MNAITLFKQKLFIPLFLFFFACFFLQSSAYATESLQIDINQEQGVTSGKASGIINGILRGRKETPIPDTLINPLKLKFVRIPVDREDLIPYVNSLGVDRIELFFLDYRIFRDGECPGTTAYPWSEWESFTTEKIRAAKSHGIDVRWEIWNEPDIKQFWPCSAAQFQELWKKTYRLIRKEVPSAVIVGPSTSAPYNQTFIQDFLNFAKANNVVPNIYSWHELNPIGADLMSSHINGYKKIFDNLRIPTPQFEINETLSGNLMLLPGEAVHFFAVSERENVNIARTCWGGTSSDCFNRSLNGLLNGTNGQPRSIYWAYKLYADLTGKLVKFTSSSSLDGLAAIDKTSGKLKILIGNHENASDARLIIKNVNSTSQLLDSSGKAYVRIAVLPTSGTAEVSSLPVYSNTVISPTNGNLSIALPTVNKGGAISVMTCSSQCPTSDLSLNSSCSKTAWTNSVCGDNLNGCPTGQRLQTRTVTPAGCANTTRCQNDPTCSTSLTGDANGNGKVDGQDYVIWLQNYGKTTSDGISVGDFNTDGKVDGVDYALWLTHLN